MKTSLFGLQVLLLLQLLCCVCSGAVIELDSSTFESEVSEGEWLVEFYTPWCGVCKQFTPVFTRVGDQLTADPAHKIRFGKVDADAQLALSSRFMITSIPTVYHIKDGVVRQTDIAKNDKEFANNVAAATWNKNEPWEGFLAPFSTA